MHSSPKSNQDPLLSADEGGVVSLKSVQLEPCQEGGSSSSCARPDFESHREPTGSAVVVAGQRVEVWNDRLFEKLRALHGIADDFLDQPLLPLDNGGKGGSPMYITEDRQYILKGLSRADHNTLLENCGAVTGRIQERKSLLCPIYLHFREAGRPSSSQRQPLRPCRAYIAMRNAMPDTGPWAAKYDLKGCADDKTLEYEGERVQAVHKRFWTVHLFSKCCWNSARRKYIDGKVRARNLRLAFAEKHCLELLEMLAADASWLADRGIMDYSLLVGVRRFRVQATDAEAFSEALSREPPLTPLRDFASVTADFTEARVVSVAIVDYLQRWNTFKRMARCIKCLERDKATVHPLVYCSRFKSHFSECFLPDPLQQALPGSTEVLEQQLEPLRKDPDATSHPE